MVSSLTVIDNLKDNKRLAKALTGHVVHTTLVEISCHGSFYFSMHLYFVIKFCLILICYLLCLSYLALPTVAQHDVFFSALSVSHEPFSLFHHSVLMLTDCFSVTMHCISWEASMRLKQFLCVLTTK